MKITKIYGRNFGRTTTHEQINNLLKLKENKMGQTAVEWLEELCNDRGYVLMAEYFEHAKQMEKEQMIDAIVQYQIQNNCVYSENGILNTVKKAEQYYNETYGE